MRAVFSPATEHGIKAEGLAICSDLKHVTLILTMPPWRRFPLPYLAGRGKIFRSRDRWWISRTRAAPGSEMGMRRCALMQTDSLCVSGLNL